MKSIITPVVTSYFRHPATRYKVSVPVFQGPLDLLLQLIENAELDITKIALAQVTTQFLDHLQAVEQQAPDEVSSFLVIAAKLLQIKSEALLPRPPVREPGEEDPGEALAEQLRRYKQFKEIAGHLDELQRRGLRTYLRVAAPIKINPHLELGGLTIEDLAATARYLLTRETEPPILNYIVTRPKVTIGQKIVLIVQTLRNAGKTTFSDLIKGSPTRMHVVMTFLALLELIKRLRVTAHQERLFGEIHLQPAEAWSEETDFESEFGE
ncbi:MAG: segregation/condensation protein A [Chloroflexota bacterium]